MRHTSPGACGRPKHAESGNFGMTGPGPAFGNKTIIGSPEGSK